MPLYEYHCVACGRRFEQLQPAAASPAPACPDCGRPTEKLLSAPGALQIKEGGHPAGGQPCCGAAGPCDHPKRCCEQ
ncbi:MAG: zinc ribbon domain-containing protein [Myxococcales bacterium]|nr:zinc ribbon domain-containing protein [Myxococcales bacterium]